MEYILICIVSFLGSGLTLFSGFGLGTILLPVFAIFFPVELAIALTAIVHFLNNIFKLFLMGRFADKKVVLRFGIASLIASFAGALLLTVISDAPPLYTYETAGKVYHVTTVKLIIAAVLAFFALFEIIPRLANLQFPEKYMLAGGLISGFFGGLSGNQGALRSAFLIRADLKKEVFIGTGVVIACMVDIARLTVYSGNVLKVNDINYSIMIAATMSAFAGAFLGSRLIKKITIKAFQNIVAFALLAFSILLAAGIV